MDNSPQNYKAQRILEDKIGFLGAILGLAIQPWETTQLLLANEKPKFIFTFFFILTLVIFGPAIFYYFKFYNAEQPLSRAAIYFFAYVLFLTLYITLEGIFLFVLGIEFSFGQLLALVIYSLTPLISLFLIIYTFYYMGSRDFSFINMIAQGSFPPPQAYAKIIPYLIIICQLSSLMILAFGIRALAEAHPFSALLYSLMSIIPITMAGFCTAFVTNFISPGSKDLVFAIINLQISVWGY